MNRSRLDRLSLLSGVIFVILYLAAMVLAEQTEYLPAADSVVTLFNQKANRISFAGYLGTVSAFFLLWFTGSLRNNLNWMAETRDALSDIAFGGGIAAAGIVAVAFSGLRALAQRAGTEAGINPEAAIIFTDNWGELTGVALPIAFAAFILATGLAIIRLKVLPAWFGWVTVILGIGLLSPLIYVLLPVGLLWMMVLSLWLYRRSGLDLTSTNKPVRSNPAENPAREMV